MGRASILVVAAGLCLLGCGGDPYTLAPVAGVVTIDGEPAAAVMVTFVGEGMTGVGRTDTSGRYRLERGAVVGANTVYLSKFVGGGASGDGLDPGQLEAMAAAQGGPRAGGPRQVIPRRYSDPALTELQVDVPAGGTDAANFTLTSD